MELNLAILHEAIAAAVPDRECIVWRDRRFTWRERVKLTLHLRVCTACTRFARQLAVMREAMNRYRA